jgi:hypothetical protein
VEDLAVVVMDQQLPVL